MRAVKTIPVATTAHVRRDIDGTVSPIGVKVCESVISINLPEFYQECCSISN